MPRSLRRDDRGVSTLWSFVGVVILIAAILGVYYGYVVPKFAPPPLRAQSGDSVQVDYVGTFAENGLVFDTSILPIAQDNASYPKAFMFAWHGSYAPLPVTIGRGGVVRGFDTGIQGLAIGDSKTIVVPPALGYGPADPTKIFVKPLVESVPVRLTMDLSTFVATYQAAAVSGTNVTDPFWGWTATVSVAGSIVTVTNSPIPANIGITATCLEVLHTHDTSGLIHIEPDTPEQGRVYTISDFFVVWGKPFGAPDHVFLNGTEIPPSPTVGLYDRPEAIILQYTSFTP